MIVALFIVQSLVGLIFVGSAIGFAIVGAGAHDGLDWLQVVLIAALGGELAFSGAGELLKRLGS